MSSLVAIYLERAASELAHARLTQGQQRAQHLADATTYRTRAHELSRRASDNSVQLDDGAVTLSLRQARGQPTA